MTQVEFLQFYNQCAIVVYSECTFLCKVKKYQRLWRSKIFHVSLNYSVPLWTYFCTYSQIEYIYLSVCGKGLMLLIGLIQINFYEEYHVYWRINVKCIAAQILHICYKNSVITAEILCTNTVQNVQPYCLKCRVDCFHHLALVCHNDTHFLFPPMSVI